MTKTEADRIDALAEQVSALAVAVATMAAEFRGFKTTTQQAVEHMRELCDERHGANKERVEHLEKGDRRSLKTEAALKGMVAPAAIFVAIVALLINIFT